MKLFFLLNKSNVSLSKGEALALARLCSSNPKIIEEKEDYLIIEVDNLCEELKNVAFNKLVGEIVEDISDLKGDVYRLEGCSFQEKRSMLQQLNKAGILLDKTAVNELYVCSGYLLKVIKKVKEKEFSDREPQNRPGFMPFTLRPRIAQTLVNLAEVREGDVILDAFCGIGGILLESCVNAKAKGVCLEKYKDILWKAKKNFDHYNCKGRNWCILGDAKTLPFKDNAFDAIITDMPYGRASKVDKEIKHLYTHFFLEVERVLKPNKKAVIMTNYSSLDLPSQIVIEEHYSIYVHKSLTRNIFVLRKK